MIRVCPLFSGSSGNALYVECAKTRILIDAGLSGAKILAELKKIGVEPEALDAILVTHEHTDHTQGVGVLSRKYRLPVYATQGTWDAMTEKIGSVSRDCARVVEANTDFYIGAFDVESFSLPHDAADPVGYAICAGDAKLAVATDIGHIRDNWMRACEGADLVLMESNHDVDMLKAGPYPYELKRRILGKNGHLSNEDAGKAAARLLERGVKHILLGHLSGENNFPELARATVATAVGERASQSLLGVASRDHATGIFTLRPV